MKKTPPTHVDVRNANNNPEDFDRKRNKLFNFPFINKKEWLGVPVLGDDILAIPNSEHFEVEQQEVKNSCGMCAAKMVVNKIFKDNEISVRVSEQDIIRSLLLPKIPLLQNMIGMAPSQLESGIQELLDEHNIDYTTKIRHFLSYLQIKKYLAN